MSKIGIIDFGYGNLGSLYGSLSTVTYDLVISNNYRQLKKSEIIFLPGIGSAGVFENNFKKSGLKNFLLDFVNKEKKLIAICLGFQFLFSHTTEDGGVEGLNIFPQSVKRINKKLFSSSRTGWYKVNNTKKIGLKSQSGFFYFNHTYAVELEKKNPYHYGESDKYLSWLKHKNIIGFQFHPEKSQLNGKTVLNNLVAMS